MINNQIYIQDFEEKNYWNINMTDKDKNAWLKMYAC